VELRIGPDADVRPVMFRALCILLLLALVCKAVRVNVNETPEV
jgi:hypothetical protein